MKWKYKQELKNLNAKKSCGWNPILPLKLLCMIAEGITPSLTYLYNECIEEGQWPRDWKKGECIPVFKKGDSQKEENYHPIKTPFYQLISLKNFLVPRL